MSSRVQKGGTLFRPVSKQWRSASESPSKPATSRTAVHSSETPNPMPPPPSVPQRLETPTLSLISEQQDTDDSQTGRSSVEPPRAIPNVVTARVSTPIAVGSSRKPPTPITVGSRSSSIPIPPSPTPRAISAPSRSTNARPLTESHQPAPLPLAIANNNVTRSMRTPPPEPPSSSTPSKKRPVSATEPESGLSGSPPKRARRSQCQTATKSTPRKKGSRGTLTSEQERSPGSTPEPGEGGEPGATPKSSQKRHRKKSPIPYDPDQPGIELDPTAVTMASICVDTGQGRVSSKANEVMKNHLAWKAANRERRAHMVAEMEAKKYGNAPESTTASNPPPSTPMNPPPQDAHDGSAPTNNPATGNNEFDYSQTMSSSKFNVRVRIGPNGETTVDEESLYVDNSAEQETHDYTHVEESDTTKFVNSATHSKKLRGSRWSAMETELFYDALSQFGENYELISYVLPGRDRKACKNKFKAEDRRNPARIDQCLKNRIPYDIQTLARMTGKDFSGPVPVIKAPTPLRMVEDDAPAQQKKEETPAPRKKSRTPGLQPTNDAEEVLGDVDDYEDSD